MINTQWDRYRDQLIRIPSIQERLIDYLYFSAQYYPKCIPFIDELINSVRAEIGTEKSPSPEPFFAPVPSISPSLSTTSSDGYRCDANSPFPSCSGAVPSGSAPATVILTADKPLTIIGEDGKEYRVVLQPVSIEKADPSTSSEEYNRVPKRKASVTQTSEPKCKRAPGVSLANMSDAEIAERKKEQNRIAAQRYREKQRESKQSDRQESSVLIKRNAFLRQEEIRLQTEIDEIRSLLFKTV